MVVEILYPYVIILYSHSYCKTGLKADSYENVLKQRGSKASDIWAEINFQTGPCVQVTTLWSAKITENELKSFKVSYKASFQYFFRQVFFPSFLAKT